MNKRISFFMVLVLSVCLCITATSCFSLVSVIDFIYGDALDTDDIEDREYAYGDSNPLCVTFEDGKMYAEWDVENSAEYELTVSDGSKEKSYDVTEVNGKTCLSDLGYAYYQDLTLTLKYTKTTIAGKTSYTVGYSYDGLNGSEYDTYAKTVNAGFSDVDYYIANRSEFFDFWSYLIIFRENCEEDKGVYELESSFYIAYDYCDLYGYTYPYTQREISDAFGYEVYSAIDAYEDSAAYQYYFDVDTSGKIGTVYMKFLYDEDPSYITDSNQKYENVRDNVDKPHYSTPDVPNERNFAIDSQTKTVEVNSSDQLYYALKKGYRPEPKKNSNADYLYKEMRAILSEILTDNSTDVEKAHYIYDYLVDTVIYDYEFTDEVYADDEKGVRELFSYRCLYMEGVFGLGENGVFNDEERVAICDGLSKAYLCMAVIEGLDCIKISGTVDDEGHAWNKVKVEDSWYMVDVTWGNSLDTDTNKEYFCHDYALVADDAYHKETAYITYPDALSRYPFGPSVDNNPNGNGNSTVRPWWSWQYRDPQSAA